MTSKDKDPSPPNGGDKPDEKKKPRPPRPGKKKNSPKPQKNKNSNKEEFSGQKTGKHKVGSEGGILPELTLGDLQDLKKVYIYLPNPGDIAIDVVDGLSTILETPLRIIISKTANALATEDIWNDFFRIDIQILLMVALMKVLLDSLTDLEFSMHYSEMKVAVKMEVTLVSFFYALFKDYFISFSLGGVKYVFQSLFYIFNKISSIALVAARKQPVSIPPDQWANIQLPWVRPIRDPPIFHDGTINRFAPDPRSDPCQWHKIFTYSTEFKRNPFFPNRDPLYYPTSYVICNTDLADWPMNNVYTDDQNFALTYQAFQHNQGPLGNQLSNERDRFEAKKALFRIWSKWQPGRQDPHPERCSTMRPLFNVRYPKFENSNLYQDGSRTCSIEFVNYALFSKPVFQSNTPVTNARTEFPGQEGGGVCSFLLERVAIINDWLTDKEARCRPMGSLVYDTRLNLDCTPDNRLTWERWLSIEHFFTPDCDWSFRPHYQSDRVIAALPHHIICNYRLVQWHLQKMSFRANVQPGQDNTFVNQEGNENYFLNLTGVFSGIIYPNQYVRDPNNPRFIVPQIVQDYLAGKLPFHITGWMFAGANIAPIWMTKTKLKESLNAYQQNMVSTIEPVLKTLKLQTMDIKTSKNSQHEAIAQMSYRDEDKTQNVWSSYKLLSLAPITGYNILRRLITNTRTIREDAVQRRLCQHSVDVNQMNYGIWLQDMLRRLVTWPALG